MAQQPLVGQGLFIIQVSRSHSVTQNQTALEDLSTRSRDTTLTRDRNPFHLRDSNPQSHQTTADPRLRPRGHWKWLNELLLHDIVKRVTY